MQKSTERPTEDPKENPEKDPQKNPTNKLEDVQLSMEKISQWSPEHMNKYQTLCVDPFGLVSNLIGHFAAASLSGVLKAQSDHCKGRF